MIVEMMEIHITPDNDEGATWCSGVAEKASERGYHVAMSYKENGERFIILRRLIELDSNTLS